MSEDELPSHWGREERELWESDPMTWRELYSQEDYERLQEVYERAWFKDQDETPEERQAAREEYWDITTLMDGSFDWASYREYLGYGTV